MNIENMNIEKATERCNQLTKPEHANWIGISNQKAIETVLSELEKKDKEIKQLKSMELKAKYGIASITLEGLINLENEIKKKDTEIIEAKEANRQLSLELEKKDKIINEMANKLVEAHSWFYSEFDNFSKEDFIKYFTNKVTDINVGE